MAAARARGDAVTDFPLIKAAKLWAKVSAAVATTRTMSAAPSAVASYN